MQPPRQIPIPTAPPTTKKVWGTFKQRLTNYVAQVGQSFQAQQLRQITVQGLPGVTGTVPFEINVHPDGTPEASLIADGMTLRFSAGVPGAGEWGLTVGVGMSTVTLGTPATDAWFSWLIAR